MNIFSGEPEHLGISKLMKRYNCVASVMLLCDVLPFVTRLSKVLQGKSIDVTLLQAELKTCLDAIQSYRVKLQPRPTDQPHPGQDNEDAILPGDDNADGNYFKTTAQACTLIGVEVADNTEADFLKKSCILHL